MAVRLCIVMGGGFLNESKFPVPLSLAADLMLCIRAGSWSQVGFLPPSSIWCFFLQLLLYHSLFLEPGNRKVLYHSTSGKWLFLCIKEHGFHAFTPVADGCYLHACVTKGWLFQFSWSIPHFSYEHPVEAYRKELASEGRLFLYLWLLEILSCHTGPYFVFKHLLKFRVFPLTVLAATLPSVLCPKKHSLLEQSFLFFYILSGTGAHWLLLCCQVFSWQQIAVQFV